MAHKAFKVTRIDPFSFVAAMDHLPPKTFPLKQGELPLSAAIDWHQIHPNLRVDLENLKAKEVDGRYHIDTRKRDREHKYTIVDKLNRAEYSWHFTEETRHSALDRCIIMLRHMNGEELSTLEVENAHWGMEDHRKGTRP